MCPGAFGRLDLGTYFRKTTIDKRTITATEIPGAAEQLQALAKRLREAELELARFLARVGEARHYRTENCDSLEEWVARAGLARHRARGLHDIGLSLRGHADLEVAIKTGATDMDRAAAVSKILSRPELVRQHDEWVLHACGETLPQVRSLVRQRIEEFAQESTDVTSFQAYVRRETKENFGRARVLASDKERAALTNGQTLHRLIEDYLNRYDPQRKQPGTRRVPPTSERPDDRYIPAEVVRAVRERSGCTCEFPGCENKLALEFAHVYPHALGGARETEDLFHFCRMHHKLYDAGEFRLIGGTTNEPIFWVTGVGRVTKLDLGALAADLAAGRTALKRTPGGPEAFGGDQEEVAVDPPIPDSGGPFGGRDKRFRSGGHPDVIRERLGREVSGPGGRSRGPPRRGLFVAWPLSEEPLVRC